MAAGDTQRGLTMANGQVHELDHNLFLHFSCRLTIKKKNIFL
jgi:hypothetical protein